MIQVKSVRRCDRLQVIQTSKFGKVLMPLRPVNGTSYSTAGSRDGRGREAAPRRCSNETFQRNHCDCCACCSAIGGWAPFPPKRGHFFSRAPPKKPTQPPFFLPALPTPGNCRYPLKLTLGGRNPWRLP